MDLKGILSISGQQGLFKLVSQARNGIIVESLLTGKRMPAYATAKISALEDIAIFTVDAEKPLVEVLGLIFEKENGGAAIDHKASAKELKSYFEEVLPNYDTDRVYVSDIKRLISWYNILQERDLLKFDEEEAAEGEVAEAEVADEAKPETES